MKKHLVYGMIAMLGATTLVGCKSEEQKEAEHMRQMECVAATGDRFCRGDGELEILEEREENRYRYSNVVYGPSAPGVYTNYYGNPNYGYWGPTGFMFNDPYSSYAMSTNSFLLGAGLGGLATYALTQDHDTWSKSHKNGWKETKRENTKYRSKSGVITKEEAARRKAQSKKDRKAHQAKLKAKTDKATVENKKLRKQLKDEKLKNKQANTNLQKATKKPSKDALAAKKAELIAKAQARKDAKAAGKVTAGSKLAKNEQKAKQTGKNNKLKQKIIAKNAAKAYKPKHPTIGQKIAKSEKKASNHSSSHSASKHAPKKAHKPSKRPVKKSKHK